MDGGRLIGLGVPFRFHYWVKFLGGHGHVNITVIYVYVNVFIGSPITFNFGFFM